MLYETNKYIDSYHSSPGKRIYRVIDSIQINKNDVIADYACGNGLLALALNNHYKEYFGIDTSSSFINKCNQLSKEQNFKNTNFIKADIIEFSKDNHNKFSKAFTLDFSEHIDDPSFIKIYTSIRNTLKKEGLLIIHTPNKDFLLEKLKQKGFLPQTSGHIAVRNSQEYKRLLKKCNFKNIKVSYLNHYKKLPNLVPGSSKSRLLITCTK